MKHVFTFFVLFVSTLLFSQTTITEYTYLTKGYKLDLETGRDIKSGYQLTFIDEVSSPVSYNISNKDVKIVRNIKYYTFVNTTEKKAKAVLFIFDRADTGFKEFICIPLKNSTKEVNELAVADFYSLIKDKNEPVIGAYHYLWNALNLIASPLLNTAKTPIEK